MPAAVPGGRIAKPEGKSLHSCRVQAFLFFVTRPAIGWRLPTHSRHSRIHRCDDRFHDVVVIAVDALPM